MRDIIYGWARGFVGVSMAMVFKPQTFTQEANVKGWKWEGHGKNMNTFRSTNRRHEFHWLKWRLTPFWSFGLSWGLRLCLCDLGILQPALDVRKCYITKIKKALSTKAFYFAFQCSWLHRGILSSPCNEWRGYTLQPKDKKFFGSTKNVGNIDFLKTTCKHLPQSAYKELVQAAIESYAKSSFYHLVDLIAARELSQFLQGATNLRDYVLLSSVHPNYLPLLPLLVFWSVFSRWWGLAIYY